MMKGHTRVVHEILLCNSNSIRVFIHQQQMTIWPELLKYAPGMSAPSECSIKVSAIAFYPQSIHDLFPHHGKVAGSLHRHRGPGHHRLNPQVQHGIADIILGDGVADLAEMGLLAPQFELAAHAQQHGAFLDGGGIAVTGRQ